MSHNFTFKIFWALFVLLLLGATIAWTQPAPDITYAATLPVYPLGQTITQPVPNISYQTPPSYAVSVGISSLTPAKVPDSTYGQLSTFVSGTPSVIRPPAQYTVTGNHGGGFSQFTMTIAVVPPTPPLPAAPQFSYTTPDVYTVGTTITPLSPNSTGGAVPATVFGSVSTFAGTNNVSGYRDATGNTALFTNLWGIDIDATGNLYVSDNKRIRKITAGASVTTLAGGNPNDVSDGTGTAAGFGLTAGLAVAPSGNIFVGDMNNRSVRQITAGGSVTTFAGTGINLFDPAGVAADPFGNIFVADQANDIIREFPITGPASTYAGQEGIGGATNGSSPLLSTFNQPADLEFDLAGDLFIADEGNNMIREINTAGAVSTVAGKTNPGLLNGPVTTALFYKPLAVALDPPGNIYVSDANGSVVRMIDAHGVVVPVAGNNANPISRDGIGPEANFSKVLGLVYTNGALFATDKNSVRRIIVTGYAIDKDLPNGLSFDSATGTISGTPTVTSPATQYTITGYNTGGSYSTTITITVNPPLNTPPAITYATPQVYTTNTAITPLSPTNMGGAVTSTPNTPGFTVDQPLPTGLALDPNTGIISGTPSVASPAADYKITATNTAGSSSFTINITVNQAVLPIEIITFGQLPVQTYGDPDFPAGATSDNTATPITYTSDNASVATIVNGAIHITGAGSANITASQAGDNNFNPAVPVTQELIVNLAPLIIKANDVTRYFGQPNPPLTATFTSFVHGEGIAQLLTAPVIETSAVTTSAVGTYPIIVRGATSNNYAIQQIDGTLTILVVPPTLTIPNAFTPNGDGFNDLWNIKSIEAYPQCLVSIYTRYGNLIYQSRGYARSWDGSYNGSPLPAGTYYYIIDLKNGNPALSGYVALIR